MSNTTTTIIADLRVSAAGDQDLTARTTKLLLAAIRDYRNKSVQIAAWADQIKSDMDRVKFKIEFGHRVLDMEVRSCTVDIAEGVVERQRAADKIVECCWLLGIEGDQNDALWTEIEEGR